MATLHPNPSNQTNTAFCFLATDLVPRACPHPDSDGEALVMHAFHVAALWSAAARIAADRSGRFGDLPDRLRQFFSGDEDTGPSRLPASDPGRPEWTVGG